MFLFHGFVPSLEQDMAGTLLKTIRCFLFKGTFEFGGQALLGCLGNVCVCPIETVGCPELPD